MLIKLYAYIKKEYTINTNCIKLYDYWSRDVLNFNFSEKDLGLVYPVECVYDFSRKSVSHVMFY